MSEKSLSQIGEESATSYADYKDQARVLDANREWAEQATEESRQVVNSPDVFVRHAEQLFELRKVDGRRFAEENAVALHDLAVILAHLEGVSISTENPVKLGEKPKDEVLAD